MPLLKKGVVGAKILKFMDFEDDILLPLKNSSFSALLLISWLIYFSALKNIVPLNLNIEVISCSHI